MSRTRYIGSKARVVEEIAEILGLPTGGSFVDAFAGSGIVSRQAAKMGWPVRANDHLAFCGIVTAAQLIARSEAKFRHFGGYAACIEALNSLRGVEGFIFNEYSPSGASRSGHRRMYFTSLNAARIDAMRKRIHDWRENNGLSRSEHTVLIADLLEAANRVANIAGTYGCFLRQWASNAKKPILLTPRSLQPRILDFTVSTLDVFSLSCQPSDVAYLDPPYTKRQYAAYYHVLETIALGDEPEVGGVTGLRPWEDKSSPFCFKRKARNALLSLVEKLPSDRLLISYNSEGHIDLRELDLELRKLGMTNVHRLSDVARYTPNDTARANGRHVTEYLIEFFRHGPPGVKKITPMRSRKKLQ
jgi:adenine-specific DNA-methyltransferase